MLSSLEISTPQRALMEKAASLYAAQLDPTAETYLRNRGLSDDTIRESRLGLVSNPLPGHESYRGRLCIPFLSPAGVVALRFRTLGDDTAKYLSLPGAQPRLYNVNALHTGLPHVAITEGEFDALALTQAGLPAVGVPGANSWQKHYPRVFADFATVYVITDNDVKYSDDGKLAANPGQQLAQKIAKDVRNSTVILPPENVDVAEWILRDGPEEVLRRIGLNSVAANAALTLDSNTEAEVDPDLPPY